MQGLVVPSPDLRIPTLPQAGVILRKRVLGLWRVRPGIEKQPSRAKARCIQTAIWNLGVLCVLLRVASVSESD
jgi:hypothetical protein